MNHPTYLNFLAYCAFALPRQTEYMIQLKLHYPESPEFKVVYNSVIALTNVIENTSSEDFDEEQFETFSLVPKDVEKQDNVIKFPNPDEFEDSPKDPND